MATNEKTEETGQLVENTAVNRSTLFDDDSSKQSDSSVMNSIEKEMNLSIEGINLSKDFDTDSFEEKVRGFQSFKDEENKGNVQNSEQRDFDSEKEQNNEKRDFNSGKEQNIDKRDFNSRNVENSEQRDLNNENKSKLPNEDQIYSEISKEKEESQERIEKSEFKGKGHTANSYEKNEPKLFSSTLADLKTDLKVPKMFSSIFDRSNFRGDDTVDVVDNTEVDLDLDDTFRVMAGPTSTDPILSNIYDLFTTLTTKLDDRVDRWDELLFLLECDKVSEVKNLLRLHAKKGNHITQMTNKIKIGSLIERIRAESKKIERLNAENIETVKCLATKFKEEKGKRKVAERMCEELNGELEEIIEIVQFDKESVGKENFEKNNTKKNGNVGENHTEFHKENLNLDKINDEKHRETDLRGLKGKNLTEEKIFDKNKTVQRLNTLVKDLKRSLDDQPRVLSQLKQEKKTLTNDLLVLSTNFYKLKEENTNLKGVIANQQRIIAVLQRNISQKSDKSILTDLKCKIEVLKSRFYLEGDAQKKKEILLALKDYEKRLEDFLSVDQ